MDGWLHLILATASMRKSRQVKYPHFIHMETESEKICDLPKSCGDKYRLDRVRKSEFRFLFGHQGPGSNHLPSLSSSAFTSME